MEYVFYGDVIDIMSIIGLIIVATIIGAMVKASR